LLLAKLTSRLHGIKTAIEIGAGSGTLTLPLVRHLKEIAAVDRLFIPIAELPFLLAAQPCVQVPTLQPTLLTTRWAAFAL
jgi:hypothetical protein